MKKLLLTSALNGDGTAELGGGDAVRKAISSLKPEQITADLNAVVDYVAKLPTCNDNRVNSTIRLVRKAGNVGRI